MFAGSAAAGVDPAVMGIGPVPAVRKLLGRTGASAADLDLVELNEAFTSQSVAVIRELGLCSGGRLMRDADRGRQAQLYSGGPVQRSKSECSIEN